MTQETAHENIYQALAAVQNTIKPILKGSVAAGTKFSYSYADLGTVLDSVMPVLFANGIAISQTPALVDGKMVLRTSLFHVTGDGVIEGEYLIQARDMSDPQAIGSAVTYARRYSIISMLCLSTEDDDGLGARKQPPEPREPVNKATVAVDGRKAAAVPMRKEPPSLDNWTAAIELANTMDNGKRQQEWTYLIGEASIWKESWPFLELWRLAPTDEGKSYVTKKAGDAGITLDVEGI